MKKVMYLPLDERPCNFELPYSLSKCAVGYKMVRPLKSKMGLMKTPTSFENNREFLLKNACDSDIAVISLDQLLYGGIVPSRIHYLSVPELRLRLETLKEIKLINPSLKIYLFSLVLRCPCYSSDEEEPLFYGKCGEEIFKYGVLKSKYELGLISEEEFTESSKPLKKKIGKHLVDFETRRATNKTMIKTFIKEYSKYVDLFVIPQDDSEPFGYAMMDRVEIQKCLDENNVHANIYPGADEVGMVLFARAISDDMNIKPEITAVYPKEECKKMIPMFEAYPVHETMLKQLETIGFKYVDDSKNKLFMNYPTKKSVNMGSTPNESYADRDLPSFINKIAQSVQNGDSVIICDGAYCNGGEAQFLIDINKQVSLFDIYAYAGWNTSSNAMGTCLAQGMIRILFGNNDSQKYFTAERVIEDICYCGAVRWDVWHGYAPEHGYSLENAGCPNGIVAKEIKRKLTSYLNENFKEIANNFRINKCQLPWSRLFEVDLGLLKI